MTATQYGRIRKNRMREDNEGSYIFYEETYFYFWAVVKKQITCF